MNQNEQTRHLWFFQIEKNPLVSIVYTQIFQRFNITRTINPAKLLNLNFHPLEVVSRWRDPQLQVSENYLDLINGGQLFSNIADRCHILSLGGT